MLGSFDYHLNCSLPHYIPQELSDRGIPVIIFPKNPREAVIGKKYFFEYVLTASATYTIDGTVYRVAHAVGLVDVEMREGGLLDTVIHNKKGPAIRGTIADRNPALASKLLALKGQLKTE